MDMDRARARIDALWRDEITAQLEDYIRIPAKSPAFDRDWAANGHIDEAIARAERWCREQPVPGMTVEVHRLEGRTPVLLVEVPGSAEGTVLLYGHLDKQPEMTGWDADKGPWTPVREGDRLYGRGGADDGYAVYASLAALRTLAEQGVPHARCVILIETCEESGSYDLPPHLDALSDRIASPDLVVCLDSGCGDYERLWCTTSLRGLAGGTLRVRVLEEGVHSGNASGIAPSSFRIARALIDRLEDPITGEIRLAELHAEIPEMRREQARAAADILGDGVHAGFPFAGSARPLSEDPETLILNRSWRPYLEVTGAEGLPALDEAGNVLRPKTTLKLSMRLPPTVDGRTAAQALHRSLTSDPPQSAEVSFQTGQASTGWHAPELADWLGSALETASTESFGAQPAYMGEGGTIPFMALLGERFPEAQFLITGVLGPGSNAHGPNEFLHLPTARRLTLCVASVLADHGRSSAAG